MRVLICDDDSATRFVIKRVLAQASGCRVSECADGLQALELVSAEDVDLLILDIQMPTLDGLEVLDALRRSDKFKSLPVIVLTSERRKEIVTKLIELGILGYVLKPLRSERLMPLIDRARVTFRTRSAGRSSAGTDAGRLSPDRPALIVDGSAEYRQFFKTQAAPYGVVLAASSGIEALATFKRTTVDLVFVGADLGVISVDVLVPKLRTLAASEPLTVVAICDGKDSGAAPHGFDLAVHRTMDVTAHRAEMRRFIAASGPLEAVSALVGSVREALTNAATQVFGMMLDSEVEQPTLDPYQSEFQAVVVVVVQERFVLNVAVHLSTFDARRIAARKLSVEPAAVTEDDMQASATELATLVGGRLRAGMDEHGIASRCSETQFELHAPVLVAQPDEARGMQLRFKATSASASFVLVARVDAMSEQSNASTSQNAA